MFVQITQIANIGLSRSLSSSLILVFYHPPLPLPPSLSLLAALFTFVESSVCFVFIEMCLYSTDFTNFRNAYKDNLHLQCYRDFTVNPMRKVHSVNCVLFHCEFGATYQLYRKFYNAITDNIVDTRILICVCLW